MLTTQVFDSASIHLGKVDALSGEVTKIGNQSIGVTSFSLNGSSTIDPVNMIYYFISGSGNGLAIYGVSLQTGLVVSQNPISNSGALYFDMMRIQSDCYESRPSRLETTAGVPENMLIANKVQVYPNPFVDEVKLSCEMDLYKIELYQANGTFIYATDISGNEFTLETQQFSNGVYFLHVTSAAGKEIIKLLK
jgi:hypothetical protein